MNTPNASLNEPSNDIGVRTKTAFKYHLFMKLNQATQKIQIEYDWITTSKKGQELCSSFLHIIVDLLLLNQPLFCQIEGITVKGLVEVTRNNLIYRADPFYRNEQP